MTYMNYHEFNPASGIEELTLQELDEVEGGVAFILLAPVIGKAIGYTAVAVAGAAAGILVTKAGVEAARAIE